MNQQLLVQQTSLTEEYLNCKIEIESINSSETLRKWKVLSKAYKIGKKIWGNNFSISKLSKDMEIPLTTCKRCLSLNRVNKKTWNLIKEGKISIFKVAQICSTKNLTYQDEIVDMVIKDNLSTYQIKSFKIKGMKDINKLRHKLAIEKGYSRKSSSYTNFKNWIERGYLFLSMPKENLPITKIKELKEKLKELNNKIEEYVK
jgi:hypothetical protein